jgi:hypothetical protein
MLLITSGKSTSLLRAAYALDGCPVGEWPQTSQARRQMIDLLPARHGRAYTADEFADAVLDVGEGDARYHTRTLDQLRERAGGLKAREARVIAMCAPRPMYVVAGPVRGQVYSGHSLSAAVRAVRIDRRQCASLGGGSYSDATIELDGREMRESYDPDDGATDTESVWIAPE